MQWVETETLEKLTPCTDTPERKDGLQEPIYLTLITDSVLWLMSWMTRSTWLVDTTLTPTIKPDNTRFQPTHGNTWIMTMTWVTMPGFVEISSIRIQYFFIRTAPPPLYLISILEEESWWCMEATQQQSTSSGWILTEVGQQSLLPSIITSGWNLFLLLTTSTIWWEDTPVNTMNHTSKINYNNDHIPDVFAGIGLCGTRMTTGLKQGQTWTCRELTMVETSPEYQRMQRCSETARSICHSLLPNNNRTCDLNYNFDLSEECGSQE